MFVRFFHASYLLHPLVHLRLLSGQVLQTRTRPKQTRMLG